MWPGCLRQARLWGHVWSRHHLSCDTQENKLCVITAKKSKVNLNMFGNKIESPKNSYLVKVIEQFPANLFSCFRTFSSQSRCHTRPAAECGCHLQLKAEFCVTACALKLTMRSSLSLLGRQRHQVSSTCITSGI